ncbi:general secretion pathway protein GspB [Pseudoduganella sp.]|uniref:general secretion pathway protein GspB n=1 Tax=Pseudoduganella sp. TaxID=1880898 RepID=UPI0035B47A21
MSYILEALKKAQAERQIGSTPTIHAPTLASAPPGQGSSPRRAPLIAALVLMGAAIAGLATMLVRQQPAASPPAPALPPAASAPATVADARSPSTAAAADVPAAPTVVAPVAAPAAAAASVAAAAPAAAGATQTTAGAPVLATQPAPGAPVPQARTEAAPPKSPATMAASVPPAPSVATAVAASAAPVPPQPALKPAPVSQRAADAPATPAPAAPAPVEEHIQSLQDLPEPIQRAIPQIALGGYIYSKNPADRLLLIDKVLRREGEEVAPGLLLEKLQPKQAVFSFRGYRYRVQL